MSDLPSTPRAKTAAVAVSPTTPAQRLSTAHTGAVQSSPHYITTRRHSLYGVEDRVVIDPGSRIWKVGFSGEGRPRDVFYASKNGSSLWNLNRATDPLERAEEDRLLDLTLQACLRSVFHDSLLTDPKARKVIIVEHPMLPLHIKDIIARVLFDNQVPSVSFASSHLLSLLAAGKITGLVLDVGHLESVALPIFAARPLFPQLRTTPLAGARLTAHLRALLLMFATYLPPPTSLSAAATNKPSASRSTRVPQEVLTDAVLEEIKTRCCFVGDVFTNPVVSEVTDDSGNKKEQGGTPEVESDVELPPPSSDPTQSESEDPSQAGSPQKERVPTSLGFSTVSNTSKPPIAATSAAGEDAKLESHLQGLATLYSRQSTASDLKMRVVPPVSQQVGTGRGTLLIPGWIREKAAEVLFEGGDVDEASVVEIVLETLLKVPVDLRKTLASSILVTGGTVMLPGFIPRLYAELVRTISTPPSTSSAVSKLTSQGDKATPLSLRHQPQNALRPHRKPPPPVYDRYACLRPLVPYFAIINNPNPKQPKTARAAATSGKAPAFTPALMPWVGGSLAGVLKTGGSEIPREKWDEADPVRLITTDLEDEDEDDEDNEPPPSATPIRTAPRKPRRLTAAQRQQQHENLLKTPRSVLPDWTRSPLPGGAPMHNAPPLPPAPMLQTLNLSASIGAGGNSSFMAGGGGSATDVLYGSEMVRSSSPARYSASPLKPSFHITGSASAIAGAVASGRTAMTLLATPTRPSASSGAGGVRGMQREGSEGYDWLRTPTKAVFGERPL